MVAKFEGHKWPNSEVLYYSSIISLKYGKADLLNDALEKHNYNEKHHLLDKHNNI